MVNDINRRFYPFNAFRSLAANYPNRGRRRSARWRFRLFRAR